MKKKMTVLGGLLLAVLVSAYSVCGTYAKYISAFDASDEARVAKWNVGTLDASGKELNFKEEFSLFKNSYTYSKDGLIAWTLDSNGDPCTDSDTCDNIVAPGSHGRFTFKLSGEMETAFKVTVKLNDEDMDLESFNNVLLVKDGNEIRVFDPAYDDISTANIVYNPIRFTVDGGYTWVTFDKLEAALQDAIEYAMYLDGTGTITPLGSTGDTFNPGTFTTGEIDIYWSWAFDSEEDSANTAVDYDFDWNFQTNHEYDTMLGNAYADKDYPVTPEVKLALDITFEQVKSA